ncbi:interleukin-20 receptor subunit alpha [Xyrichtys novacula]|uniref:Interleukin-20 receptor subunit alpha n=1 Tax=Xyrichtys novacula TaxID=13765 RepID=A0AAV1GUJ2_XYRNO|nr:interleukin-20 receptor subunit alpha [Xyrichtys novacula]
MWIVVLFLNLGALCSIVSSSPPSPTEVSFSSINLRNLLQWSPGKGTPNDTHYSVQYAIYGDSVNGSKGKRVNWRSVQHCTEVVRCWCDLSSETWDLEQGYHARVRARSGRAFSKWALTRRRFDPKSDTVFGPPSVTVDIEDNNAIITIKGPMRYQPGNQTPAVPMATLYDQMTYNISVHNVRRGLMSHFPVVFNRYKYRLMKYDTEYCFSARARFLSMPVQCLSSEWHCITTPPDPWIAQLQWVFVGIIVPSACICILVVICYVLYQYLTGKGQKSPYTLNPPSFHSPPLTFPPETPKILQIQMGWPLDQDIIESVRAFPWNKEQPTTVPPPTYTAQRSEPSHEPAGPCNDPSVDYGFVCQAGEEGETRHRGGEEGNNESDSSQEWRVEEADHHLLRSTDAEAQKGALTLVSAHAFLQANSVVPHQSQRSGLFIDRAPQTFNMPLNVESTTEEEMSEEMVGRSERAPLLSGYACQNAVTVPTSQSYRSNYLPDDYGVLIQAEAQDAEKEEEEEGSIRINWDPKTRKLILPELGMEFNKESDVVQGEKERKSQSRAEEEDVMQGGLRLEAVFVRQGSEEKAEALREKERREETGWEAGDPLSKWDLIIPMDQ